MSPFSLPAHRLAHETRLQADVLIADLAFDLGTRHQRGDGVDHDDVDRVRFDQHFRNLKCFFSR